MADKTDKQEFVTHIASREEDFAQWYTDVIKKTELVDYSDVKGCMVIRPYGYAIWENMQREMDARFKATGHKNGYFPMFIPESLLKKEAEHVEGFAPEVAWVTQGGSEPLAERLAIRPTSETIFCSMYARWIQSYRDLPVLINQWCNVVRWEKSTRPFLRTSEFLWQEGHTAHATHEDAEEETLKMLDVYEDFARNVLAIPVVTGKKSEKEKFAGAESTYTMEALMQDGKALQMGTCHNLADHFAKGFNIMYLDKDGKQKYVNTTSWGTSTRMIGGIIMVHGDERGLCFPPKVAPVQVVILPIAMHKPGVLDAAMDIKARLAKLGLRVELDDRDTQSAGWKFNEWEMKGVPIRLEIGPRDMENQQVMICRRDTLEKSALPLCELESGIEAMLESIHATLLQKATDLRDSLTSTAVEFGAFEEGIKSKRGFVKAMWCGERGCEEAIKEKTGATTRCMPFEQERLADKCVHCGKDAKAMVYFARAY